MISSHLIYRSAILFNTIWQGMYNIKEILWSIHSHYFGGGVDGPMFKIEFRGKKGARCEIPKRPARGGGSWGMVAGAVDGELIAEPGRRRGFAAELYDSFPF